MDKIFIYHEGYVYGPCEFDKPEPEKYPGHIVDHDYCSHIDVWKTLTRKLPKYKWTGPPLEDWKEMIEGKDFEFVNIKRRGTHAQPTNQ